MPGRGTDQGKSQPGESQPDQDKPSESAHSHTDPLRVVLAAEFRDFGATHARGVSARYEQWALGVAEDPELIEALLRLPEQKRHPTLLFAAARHVDPLARSYQEFRSVFLDNRDAVEQVMLARRTQTNETARCAAIYPLLAALPQPLALVEVGASAGLCLLPDRYRYEYRDREGGATAGDLASPVTIECEMDGPWAPPGPVEVAWRAGIDLNPLSVHEPDEMAWLETLIWPGPTESERVRRLRAAVELARLDPPAVLRADLNEALPALAEQAPAGATLVVYHAAVLLYISKQERIRFAETIRMIGAHWIAQEAPSVLSFLPIDATVIATGDPKEFLMTLDGEPVAWTAPHGGRVRWLA